MSKTPRTDAKTTAREIRDLNAAWTVESVPAEFARKLETELAEAIEQRNHEQRCVEQKQRLIESERKEVTFEQQRGDRIKKELEESRELLSLLGVDVPQMANEVRARIAEAQEKLRIEEIALGIPECAFCKGQSDDVRAKCAHKIFDMI